MSLHDKDIREPLFDFLEETYGRVRVVEEKMMGKSRADAVMVMEDVLCGIEIKSDADTYERLSRQVRDYDLYYDINMVVVGSSHGNHIREHVPPYWGVITVEELEGKLDFYILRDPERNPKMKPERKIGILWRTELNHILEKNGLPRYAEKSKRFVAGKILEKVPPELLSRQISEELFERDYNTIGEEIERYRSKKQRSRHGKEKHGTKTRD